MTEYCPNCEKEVSPNAIRCVHCNADFSDADGWKPTANPGTRPPWTAGSGTGISGVGMDQDPESSPAIAWALIACLVTVVHVFTFALGVLRAWGNGGGSGLSALLSLIFFAVFTAGAVLAEYEAYKRLGTAHFLEKVVSTALLIPCVLISAAGVLATLFALLAGLAQGIQSLAKFAQSEPVKWTHLVSVDGQPEPVPEEWLQGAEARIAHGLKLPETVPKSVPFDFKAAYWRSWLPSKPKVAVQYFNHLCSTEAGEWIFRKEKNVEGLYFARPQGAPASGVLTDPYGPEMPWVQRTFQLTGESLHWQGAWFIQPPLYNYIFVEQPHRTVDWQKGINEPYVRLFGYTREKIPVPGVYGKAYNQRDWYDWRDKDPMQVIGIPSPSARYSYTWRGIKRPLDRENGIAGGEMLIYDLQTKEVLAVRRQFLIAGRNPRGDGKAMWEIAARCQQLPEGPGSGEFTQFAFDVLQTTEPSTTKKQ